MLSENQLVGNFPLEMAKLVTGWLLQPQDLAALCLLGTLTGVAGFHHPEGTQEFHVSRQVSGSPLALKVEVVSPLLWVDWCDVAECGQHGV